MEGGKGGKGGDGGNGGFVRMGGEKEEWQENFLAVEKSFKKCHKSS